MMDALQRLINMAPKGAKLDDIITAVEAHGALVSEPQKVADIVSAISSLIVGKKFAYGTVSNTGRFTVNNLDFTPQLVLGWSTSNQGNNNGFITIIKPSNYPPSVPLFLYGSNRSYGARIEIDSTTFYIRNSGQSDVSVDVLTSNGFTMGTTYYSQNPSYYINAFWLAIGE